MKTCEVCRTTGPDVIATMAYVGGRGYEERHVCHERFGCWARRAEQENRPVPRPNRAA
jgi:hypothetical protein